MNCVHHDMPKRPRPLTLVTFTVEEVAEALRNYACKTGGLMPTGEMSWGIGCESEIQLSIYRDEGQEVWPRKDVGDG
jgi:hypothetical protein